MRAFQEGAASPERVRAVLGPRIAAAYAETLAAGVAERARAQAAAHGARILGLWEADYPAALRHLTDPPLVLYVRGPLPPHERAVAIVGTRRASPWAKAWTRRTARALAEAGVAVVSGLARGIDTEAHAGALEGGGLTVGVLGSGLDRVYPRENQALAERVTLVSEFPFGEPPRPEYFPRRNRVVAALARAVLVVEAPPRSGALITAALALELGREVLAVPGRPTDPGAAGPNRLIQEGAGLVTSAAEVLEALNLAPPPTPAPELSEAEARLYTALRAAGEALPDELAEELQLTAGEVLAGLAALELKGLAQALPGGRYAAV